MCRNTAPGTVCILLTAHATIDSAIRALRQGAFDYVLKPAQPKTIIEVVERGLAKRQEFHATAESGRFDGADRGSLQGGRTASNRCRPAPAPNPAAPF